MRPSVPIHQHPASCIQHPTASIQPPASASSVSDSPIPVIEYSLKGNRPPFRPFHFFQRETSPLVSPPPALPVPHIRSFGFLSHGGTATQSHLHNYGLTMKQRYKQQLQNRDEKDTPPHRTSTLRSHHPGKKERDWSMGVELVRRSFVRSQSKSEDPQRLASLPFRFSIAFHSSHSHYECSPMQ